MHSARTDVGVIIESVKQIVLASGSPRRKELLEKTDLKFIVVKSEFKEYFNDKLTPRELAEALSFEKAKAVGKNYKDSIIIAADTLVSIEGKIFGKPKNREDAKTMLKFLSGKVHLIITGFTIIDGDKIITKSEQTKINMRKITENEINSYLKTSESYDKAGAYAIQGEARKFIEKIEGLFAGMGKPEIKKY